MFSYIFTRINGWLTLCPGTDTLSPVSARKDELSCIMEFLSNPKAVTHRISIRRTSENHIPKITHDSIDQVRSVDWDANGKLDFAMASKLRDLNSALKESKRSKLDTLSSKERIFINTSRKRTGGK